MPERVLIYGTVNPGDRGGVQSVCNRLARALQARGHQVWQAWPTSNPDREGRDGAWPLPPLVWRHGLPAPRSLFDATRALMRLGVALARLRPTVVNVHFVTSAATYFVVLKRLFRYRLVLSVHGSDILRPQEVDASVLGALLARADAVTTVSSVTKSRVQASASAPPKALCVIPNGIDYGFWAATERSAPAGGGPVVIAVGRLDPVKGHDTLLRAFSLVAARYPSVRLVIVGDGGFRAQLERLAHELGIGGAVEFRGELPPDLVRECLAAAYMFVLPSRSEGLPLALLEAMAAGVPVVATRVGGVPDVITPGTGVMVPADDPPALAEAIAQLLRDRELGDTLRRCGRERAASFSAAAAERAYERVITST